MEIQIRVPVHRASRPSQAGHPRLPDHNKEADGLQHNKDEAAE